MKAALVRARYAYTVELCNKNTGKKVSKSSDATFTKMSFREVAEKDELPAGVLLWENTPRSGWRLDFRFGSTVYAKHPDDEVSVKLSAELQAELLMTGASLDSVRVMLYREGSGFVLGREQALKPMLCEEDIGKAYRFLSKKTSYHGTLHYLQSFDLSEDVVELWQPKRGTFTYKLSSWLELVAEVKGVKPFWFIHERKKALPSKSRESIPLWMKRSETDALEGVLGVDSDYPISVEIHRKLERQANDFLTKLKAQLRKSLQVNYNDFRERDELCISVSDLERILDSDLCFVTDWFLGRPMFEGDYRSFDTFCEVSKADEQEVTDTLYVESCFDKAGKSVIIFSGLTEESFYVEVSSAQDAKLQFLRALKEMGSSLQNTSGDSDCYVSIVFRVYLLEDSTSVIELCLV